MITFLIFLLLFTASIIIIPVVLTSIGLDLDPWVLNAIAAFIGSLVAIIGSIAINLITENKKRKKAYSRELNLLRLELYNNFILALHRITNNIEVDFETYTFKNFIQFSSSTEDKKYTKIIKELQVLYFIIEKGDYLLDNYHDFCTTVYKKEHKNPDNIWDVLNIIESKSLDNIYEFAIIKNIIQLDNQFDLNINIPFKDYNSLLDHLDNTLSLKQRTALYISEQVCKSIFKDYSKVYILNEIKDRGVSND